MSARKGNLIDDNTDDRKLITELGGPTTFAHRFGYPSGTVKAWRARGYIPEVQRPVLARRLRERGYHQQAEMLENGRAEATARSHQDHDHDR